MAEIASIVYKPEGLGRDPDDRYLRVPVREATLEKGHGIRGDLKGVETRELNVMSVEALEALGAEGFKTGPGQMGEQIAIRGLDVGTLAAGAQLQIGATARIEVIKPRTGCSRFEAIQGKARVEAAGRMGIIARVVAGGTIRVGDPVSEVAERAIP